MIKLMHTGLAALIAATTIAAAATPAQAHWDGDNSGYYGYDNDGYGGGWEHRHHDHDNAAPLIIGGILGLGLLAVLASSSHSNHTQTQAVYGDGYQTQNNDHPDVCTRQRRVWDSYRGEYTTRSYRVAC